MSIDRRRLNPVPLPGMGRSIELFGISEAEAAEIRAAFASKSLAVRFDGEEEEHRVANIWPDPHDPSRMTVFIP